MHFQDYLSRRLDGQMVLKRHKYCILFQNKRDLTPKIKKGELKFKGCSVFSLFYSVTINSEGQVWKVLKVTSHFGQPGKVKKCQLDCQNGDAERECIWLWRGSQRCKV